MVETATMMKMIATMVEIEGKVMEVEAMVVDMEIAVDTEVGDTVAVEDTEEAATVEAVATM